MRILAWSGLVFALGTGCASRSLAQSSDGEGATSQVAPESEGEGTIGFEVGPAEEGPEETDVEDDEDNSGAEADTEGQDTNGWMHCDLGGGYQCGPVGPSFESDEEGDVTAPDADVVQYAVYLSEEGDVDFRVRFAAPPFDHTKTASATWCIDLDGIKSGQGSCATQADGIDLYVALGADLQGDLGDFSLGVSVEGGNDFDVDPCDHVYLDADSHTVQIIFSAAQLGVDSFEFDYILESNFGGSGGLRDWSPDVGWGTTVQVPELWWFEGDSVCL